MAMERDAKSSSWLELTSSRRMARLAAIPCMSEEACDNPRARMEVVSEILERAVAVSLESFKVRFD